MLKEILKTVDGTINGAVQAAGGNYLQTKATELVKTNFLDPRLIINTKDRLRENFGSQPFYNDFDAYITEDKTMENLFEMFYNIGKTTVLSSREFVTQKLDSFSAKYPIYGLYDMGSIKEGFEFVYEAIYNSCVRLSPYTDAGKIQLSQTIYAEQEHREHEGMKQTLDMILTCINSISVASKGLPLTTPIDVENASESIKDYMKQIDAVGSETNPVKNDSEAIERYLKLLSDVPIVLRGESENQIDLVICSIKSHLAIRHSNLGMVKEAFDCLSVVPREVAEQSKLYHFVRAMIIVGHHITDMYSEAEYYVKRALELDNDYHRAFLLLQLLVAMKKEVGKDTILSELDNRFSSILEKNKNTDLIADYYTFRGFICKEFDDYDAAEQNFNQAKEYGYDEIIADLNIGILYYCQATSKLPKNERLFNFDVDIALLYRAIEIYRNYLFGENELSPYIKTQMIDVYVACCGLIGAKHGLTPISEYVRLPNIEYETIRTLLLEYDGVIDEELLALLTPEDQFYVKIANNVNNKGYENSKIVFNSLTPDEILQLPVSTIYLILQATVVNKDLDSFKKFRCCIHDNEEDAILACLDAYALELEGDIENAKRKVESYSILSENYKLLRNVLGLYLRNDCREDANKLFLRILDLSNQKRLYIEDQFEFVQLAVRYFVNQRMMEAKLFIDSLELDNENAWCLKAEFYNKINDVQNLLVALNWLCENSFQYNYGFHKAICLTKLMRYDEALSAAESLLETIHENNIKDRTNVVRLISNIYLLMDNNEKSYEWAKKAHELNLDTPNDRSHPEFLARAMRTGMIDESLGEIIEYKRLHPVIISDWIKEIQISEGASGEEMISALNEVTGQSCRDYETIEKQFVSLYKTNPCMPNSVVLKHYGNDYVRFFGFAANHKIRISKGLWSDIQSKENLIKDHICVDVLTLMVLQHYGCIDAIKEIPHVHICYAAIKVLQNNYQPYFTIGDVRELLLWIKNATNIVFEPDGYVYDSSLSNLFDEEYIACCRFASASRIPLLTIETSIEEFSKIEEQKSIENLQTVGIVSLCNATLSKTPDKRNKAIYNLLEQCTFINFNSETIIEQIKRNDYVVDEAALSRFFICNSSCDMLSFEAVYAGTITSLLTEHRNTAIDFSMMVLENAVVIWRKSSHYRFLVERFNDQNARTKNIRILEYLVLLIYDIEQIFENNIPEKTQEVYSGIKKSIYDYYGDEFLQKVKSSLESLDNKIV